MWLTVAPMATRVLMGDVDPAVVESCMDGRCPDCEATELWSYLCTVFRLPLLFLSSLGVNSIGYKPYCDNCATQSGRKSFTSALTWVCASRDESGVFANSTELISQQPLLLYAVLCKSHKPHTSSAHALILSSITQRKPFQWCILDIRINI